MKTITHSLCLGLLTIGANLFGAQPSPMVIDDQKQAGDTNQALWAAIKTNNVESAQRAINNGADVETKDQFGSRPLGIAAHFGHEAMVRFLVLHAHANVNIIDKQGCTPLHCAADSPFDTSAVARFLVNEAHADINAKDSIKMTPLHTATFAHKKTIVSILALDAHTDFEAKNKFGQTALDLARTTNDNEIVAILEQAYASRIHTLKELTHKNNIACAML